MRDRVIAEAREWVGTPYQHQARLKGVAVDCIGLVVVVGRAVGVLEITDAELAVYDGYGRLPNPRRMGAAMRRHLQPVEPGGEQPGDVAWMQWREGLPMHVGIITGPTLIHAYGDVGRVVEHRLTPEWRDRIVGYWRFPGIDEWRS